MSFSVRKMRRTKLRVLILQTPQKKLMKMLSKKHQRQNLQV